MTTTRGADADIASPPAPVDSWTTWRGVSESRAGGDVEDHRVGGHDGVEIGDDSAALGGDGAEGGGGFAGGEGPDANGGADAGEVGEIGAEDAVDEDDAGGVGRLEGPRGGVDVGVGGVGGGGEASR